MNSERRTGNLQMKTTHILLAAILAATSVVQAATAEHKLPAPLPEFKTPEQLAVWRKEMAEKSQSSRRAGSQADEFRTCNVCILHWQAVCGRNWNLRLQVSSV